jgi:HlyD family secretion protein
MGTVRRSIGAMMMLLALAACQGQGGETQSVPAPDHDLLTAVALARVEVEGGLIQVAAQRDAVIRSVMVNEGDAVSRGQILAVQDTRAAELQVGVAEASLAVEERSVAELRIREDAAQRELERMTRLAVDNAVSRRQMDEVRDTLLLAKANHAQGQARIAASRARLDADRFEIEVRTIRSPVNGVIARRQAQPGVGASTLNVSTLFTIIPRAPLQVRAELDEIFIDQVAVGQSVRISPEAQPKQVYEGTVARIGRILGQRRPTGTASGTDLAANPDQRVVEVVITAENLPLLIGQRVLVRFEREEKRAMESERGTIVAEPIKSDHHLFSTPDGVVVPTRPSN